MLETCFSSDKLSAVTMKPRSLTQGAKTISASPTLTEVIDGSGMLQVFDLTRRASVLSNERINGSINQSKIFLDCVRFQKMTGGNLSRCQKGWD